MENREAGKRMSAAGRRHIEERYSMDQMIARVEAPYASLLKKKRGVDENKRFYNLPEYY